MKKHITILTMLLAAQSLLCGCSLTYEVPTKDSKKDAATQATRHQTYKIALPVNNTLLSVLLLELLRDFNDHVGFDVLIVPNPLATPTSEVKWSTGESLENAACRGEALIPTAMRLTLDSEYAKTFYDQKGHLSETDLYRLFSHCVGDGLGLGHSNAEAAIMFPAVGQDFEAFYEQVRAAVTLK